MLKKSISINLSRTPRPQHWYNISFGSSRCHICLTLNTSKKYIGCEIYIRDDMDLYNIFYKNKESIESNIQSKLIWKDLPNATASRIQSIYECNPEDRSQWNEYFEWCTNEIQKFADEFTKYIK